VDLVVCNPRFVRGIPRLSEVAEFLASHGHPGLAAALG
jgi:hypothetical protein